MSEWKPRNKGGTIYYDPKDELAYWIRRAGSDPMVAVPLDLLIAVERRRECGAVIIITADEDGPLDPTPVRCTRDAGHVHRGVDHYNGYIHWRVTDEERRHV